MPAVTEGVEGDRTRGTWYFTATLARDAVGDGRLPVTRRVLPMELEATMAPRTLLGERGHGGTGADAKLGPGDTVAPGPSSAFQR
jgi:hypothetical protein